MRRNLVILIGGVLSLWIILGVPAFFIAGETALLFTGTAAVICLVPGVGTMVWCHRKAGGTPEQRLAAVMGGTVIRIGAAIGMGMVLFIWQPLFHETAFLIWVIVFYLATLALEVTVLIRELPANSPQQQQ